VDQPARTDYVAYRSIAVRVTEPGPRGGDPRVAHSGGRAVERPRAAREHHATRFLRLTTHSNDLDAAEQRVTGFRSARDPPLPCALLDLDRVGARERVSEPTPTTSSRSDSVVSSSAGDSASSGRNGGVWARIARSSVSARRARVSAGVVPER
jgi:hypothetical protein